MPGWIRERALTDETTVFEIGYRVGGRTVRRKGGNTRREAEWALIVAPADIENGKIRAHTTDTLAVYAARWLERRAPFVEPGTIQAYRNDFAYRINPTLGDVRLRDLTGERIEAAIRAMQELKPRRGSPNPTYSAWVLPLEVAQLVWDIGGDRHPRRPTVRTGKIIDILADWDESWTSVTDELTARKKAARQLVLQLAQPL